MSFSRRGFLAVGAALTAAACSPPTTPAHPTLSDPAEPLPPLDQRITALEKRHNAFVGLYGQNLDTKQTVAHRDGDPFAMCSTFKAYLSARVLQKAQAGELALADTVVVDPELLRPNSPRTEPNVGKPMALSDLCAAALQVSDNTAANLLLRVIGGPPAITAFARSIGDQTTRLDRWETELNSALPGDPRDTSTPRALGSGILTVLTGDVLDDPHRTQLEDWMRANTTSSMRAGLPPGWTTADKTGSGDFASTNDVGIAFGPSGERLLLAIMTRTQSSDANTPALRDLVGEVATLALPVLLGKS
ncbi:beta-lactamase class A [Mycolicibacterium sp. BK556]|uniref:class A beta-lactamase n=1 Tax=unclassified Mycolicibacterium TaxID=2636767 RepID=UPI00160E5D9E|nr:MULTISPECIES: class A beta-lactamase [unclassified Mycolicibacterium]MBB3604628.1 beta-lactamase class A [Mycolicibacterium sp. BK556]MBB3634659.1 beta-lactamase class A [Mycolicibacterium sp. BK607]